MLYSGIDLHKRTAVISTVDESGQVVAEASVRTSRADVARYFQWLPEPTVATVEATSSWYWLRDLLAQEDVPLTLAHAKFVKAIAYAKVKTDKVDALTLAQLLRADLIPPAHMVSPELRPLRDLLRTRLHPVEKRTSAKNSVERLLEKYNVVRPEALPDEATMQAELYAEQIELLTDQIRRIEKQLDPQLIPNPDIQRLLWIPGIGRLVAFTLYLEIDGIERFPSVKQFFSYARVVPGADNSAAKRRHRHRKDGNRYIKLALSHAAVRAVQYYPVIKRFYQKKARQKEPCYRAHSRPEGDRSRGLRRPQGAGRIQPHLQGPAALEAEDSAVASSGKPRRLTDRATGQPVRILSMIGMPDVVIQLVSGIG